MNSDELNSCVRFWGQTHKGVYWDMGISAQPQQGKAQESPVFVVMAQCSIVGNEGCLSLALNEVEAEAKTALCFKLYF